MIKKVNLITNFLGYFVTETSRHSQSRIIFIFKPNTVRSNKTFMIIFERFNSSTTLQNSFFFFRIFRLLIVAKIYSYPFLIELSTKDSTWVSDICGIYYIVFYKTSNTCTSTKIAANIAFIEHETGGKENFFYILHNILFISSYLLNVLLG